MSVGEQLKRARTESRLSIKEVTQATKIQPWVLENLEADRLHLTMSPIYTKGFLTTYAKFLRLNPDPLIARLFPEPTPAPVVEPSRTVTPPRLQLVWPDWLSVRRAATAAVGLAGVVALIALNPLRWIPPKATPHQEASLTVATKQPVPSAAILTIQPSQPLELVILARRTTWVSVRADGQLLAQQQVVAGSQETWKARRLFELVISKPAQVEVWLNGQSISPLAIAHQGQLVITHTSIKPLADLSTPPARSEERPARTRAAQTGSSP